MNLRRNIKKYLSFAKSKDATMYIKKKKPKGKSYIQDSIHELSAFDYYEIIDTGDLSILILEGEVSEQELNETWENLNWALLEHKGLDNETKTIAALERDILAMEIELITTSDRKLISLIKIKKRELDGIKPKETTSKVNPQAIASTLHVHYKMDIDLKKISIARFQDLIQQYNG